MLGGQGEHLVFLGDGVQGEVSTEGVQGEVSTGGYKERLVLRGT